MVGGRRARACLRRLTILSISCGTLIKQWLGRLAKPHLDGAATRLAARAEVAVLAGDQVETVWVSTAEVEPPLPERLRLAMVVDAFVPQALDARGRPMPGDACNC